MRGLIALGLFAIAAPAGAQVWADGVWAPGVWADGVWATAAADVTVPDVIGDDEATATAAIEAVGLVVAALTKCSIAMAGDVFAQSPIGGTMVEEGSTVNISVSSGTPCAGLWIWLILEGDL